MLLARRAAPVEGGAVKPEGVRAVAVGAESDLGMEALDAFAVASGFPAGWAGDMLGDGAEATLALANVGGQTGGVAMGWRTSGRFFVEELGATLEQRYVGTYLFGDFVSPAFRGRGIQRWLVAERLRALGDTKFGTCTIVHPSNVTSLRNYQQEGFETLGSFTRYWWARRTWARCRTRAGATPRFELRDGDMIAVQWDQ